MMRALCIIQARLGSVRFPRKVAERLEGKALVHFLYDRIARWSCRDVVIAVPDKTTWHETFPDSHYPTTAPTAEDACAEADVLKRFYLAVRREQSRSPTPYTHVVRVTADCPLLDPALITAVMGAAETGADYVATRTDDVPSGWPDGTDVECFTVRALYRAHETATTAADREHVTPRIQRRGTSIYLQARPDYTQYKWSVDTPADLAHVRALYALLPANFGMRDLIRAEGQLTHD
jgi:spore coat polysaccharide biosynthesis protein SpsF (cytidylyltransferase family)